MTYDTCKRLAEHCRKMGDIAGAKMYEERAERKKAKMKISEKSKSPGKE